MKNILLILLFCYLNLSAASIVKLFNSYSIGDIDYCKKHINSISRKYKHNSNVYYLNGLLNPNGLKSYNYFNKIITDFNSSSRKKSAIKKINDYKFLENYISNKSKSKQEQPISVNKIIKDIAKSIVLTTPKNKDEFFGDNKIYLQLGAFGNKKNALKLTSKTHDIKTFIYKFTKPSGKIIFRVLTGPFLDKGEKYYQVKNTLFDKFNISSINISSKNL